MIGTVALDVYYVASYPPVCVLACDDSFIQSACSKHVPLRVITEMSGVRDVLVFELADEHLLDSVRPRVEINLTTLCIERKVGYLDDTFCVDANLGNPRDQACMRNPCIEKLHLVQIVVDRHSMFIELTSYITHENSSLNFTT